jgi:hypothetical protein
MQRRAGLYVIGAGAAVSLWGGWVGLGGLSGFGEVQLLPGIWDSFKVNTAITLPLSLEAYGMVALGYALKTGIASFAVGMAAQATFHLLTSWHKLHAPWPIIVAVSWVPVIMLGLASVLYHLAGQKPDEEPAVPARTTAELFDEMARTITPVPETPDPGPDGPLPEDEGTEPGPWLPPDDEDPGPAGPLPEPAGLHVPSWADEALAMFDDPAPDETDLDAEAAELFGPSPAPAPPPVHHVKDPRTATGKAAVVPPSGKAVPKPPAAKWTPEGAGLTVEQVRADVAALSRNKLAEQYGVGRSVADRIRAEYGQQPALNGSR